MTLLNLFLVFLKIGTVAFGGGYGIISLIKEECLNHGWLTLDELLNFIAVSESTPGPIAINMATFVGSSQAGVLGAIVATLGVVLPCFIIMILVAHFFKNLIKYPAVNAVLNGIKPVFIGLIIATSISIFLTTILNLTTINSTFIFNWKGLIIFNAIGLTSILYKYIVKKPISPILLIIFSGVLGILIF